MGVIAEELKNTRTINSFSCHLIYKIPSREKRTWNVIELRYTMSQEKSTSTTHIALIKDTFLCLIYLKRPVLAIIGVITMDLKNTETINSFSCHLIDTIQMMRKKDIGFCRVVTIHNMESRKVLQQLTKPSSKQRSTFLSKFLLFWGSTLRSWTQGYSAPFPAI
jgi:hypothetical protein